MAKIFPFHGVLYNKKKVKDLSKVITPPYDVISPEMQDFYYSQSDFNVIRLILGKDFPEDNEYNNKYVRASSSFEGWVRHEILKRSDKPCIYIYEQRFSHNRKKYSRIGVIALLRLEDFGKGKVFPHEYTLSKPKQDRIDLIKATSSNFDCIFSLFPDEKGKFFKNIKKILRRKPDAEAKGSDGIVNRLWEVNQKNLIQKIQKELKDKPVFIADGHHRYEAALKFKNEMKVRNTRFTEEEAYNHVMMYFTPIENPGLVILPIHRMIKNAPPFDLQFLLSELGNYFEIVEIPFSKRTEKAARKKLMAGLKKLEGKHAFGFYIRDDINKYYLLSLKSELSINDLIDEDKPAQWKKLDVTILRAIVFEKILNITKEEDFSFTRDENEALDCVKAGRCSLCVILNPTKIEEIVNIAGKYERMPQKSTYFYPKLMTCITMNKLD